jgi:LuxR family maltose regulon positive regulatory protein
VARDAANTAVAGALPPEDSLSDRELSVLRLLRGDLTQREIADELYIAPSTVKTHIKAIYRKLGVNKRAHAVTRAAELGLIG